MMVQIICGDHVTMKSLISHCSLQMILVDLLLAIACLTKAIFSRISAHILIYQ